MTRGHRFLAIHTTAILGLTVLYIVLWVVFMEAPDADPLSGIGVAPALVPLVGLGLPWSTVFFSNPYSFDGFSDLTRHVFMVGPAWINVALHALVHVVRSRPTDQP